MRLLFVALTIAFVFALKVPAVEAAGQSDLNFTVLRNGSKIGTHVYKFQSTENRQKIEIITDIKVKIAFFTAYEFEHEATEEWIGDDFVGTKSITNDDGKNLKLDVIKSASGFVVRRDGKLRDVEPGIMPASLWNPETVRHSVLLNTLDGSEMNVTVENLGTEKVDVNGNIVPATHYKLTGDLERELWFDTKGTLSKVRFTGDDGSDIQYVLR